MSKGVNLYFVRHGETYFNQLHRVQGWSDTPLTEKGERDIVRSAIGLEKVKFSQIYSSDIGRAMQTAKIILEHNAYTDTNATIQAMREFREEFFGSLEGLDGPSAIKNMQKYVLDHQMTFPPSIENRMNIFHQIDPLHEAETFNEFWKRVEGGIIQVVRAHRETNENILIVSHGMAIYTIVRELIASSIPDTFLDNGSVTIVRYQDGQFHLDAYNQTSHFKIEEAAEPDAQIGPLDQDWLKD